MMGDEPIYIVMYIVIQSVTIDTMLNNNGLNTGEGLNFVSCEQTFPVTSNNYTWKNTFVLSETDYVCNLPSSLILFALNSGQGTKRKNVDQIKSSKKRNKPSGTKKITDFMQN